jgi:hypothetical protein
MHYIFYYPDFDVGCFALLAFGVKYWWLYIGMPRRRRSSLT